VLHPFCRIAIDLFVRPRDFDCSKAGTLDAWYHFGAAGEGNVMAALGQSARDAETWRQVPAPGPVQPQHLSHVAQLLRRRWPALENRLKVTTRSWALQESQIERCERQDDADIRDQPFRESVSEEHEIYADDDGHHRRHVKDDSYLPAQSGQISTTP
jgi:hypothetical protein